LTKNKHGLPRDIPDDIRREIRRRCAFGCVICGSAVTTYEHFNPPFKDAKIHEPKGITLLCGSDQLKSSKNWLSKESIAAADKNPKCKQAGYASEMFDLGGVSPTIMLGSVQLVDCGHHLTINGKPCLAVKPPESGSQRWRISAEFTDEEGRPVCRIIDNELQICEEVHDFEQVKNRFTIRETDGTTLLAMRVEAPYSLHVDRMLLRMQGRFAQAQTLEINGDDLICRQGDRIARVSTIQLRGIRPHAIIRPDAKKAGPMGDKLTSFFEGRRRISRLHHRDCHPL
jgi:hypothetical protein